MEGIISSHRTRLILLSPPVFPGFPPDSALPEQRELVPQGLATSSPALQPPNLVPWTHPSPHPPRDADVWSSKPPHEAHSNCGEARAGSGS